jgi:hypothetical protein
MKRLLLLSLSMLFLTLGAWTQPASAASFDGGHYQLASHRSRRHHHHRAHRRHHRHNHWR